MPADLLALKQILPLLIPIVAIVGGLAVAIVSIALDYKKKSQWLEAHHRERLAAIERGTELPPLPAGFFGERAPADAATRQARQVRWGLVLALGGAAVALAQYLIGDHDSAAWALVPIAVGLALLLSTRLAPAA